MLKVIGAVLVIAGAVGISFSYRQDMQNYLNNTRCFFIILELLESEIQYSKASLPEACRMVAQRVEEPLCEGLMNVWKGMCENRGLTFSIVWRQEMGKCLNNLPAGKKEKEQFMQFADSSGFADNRMQLRAMERCREILGQSIKKQEEAIENKTKVVMSMGLIGGLFLTIVLL